MRLVGFIILLFGSGLIYYGYSQNSSWSSQILYVLGSGKVNPGTPLIVFGAIAAVVGIILLICYAKK